MIHNLQYHILRVPPSTRPNKLTKRSESPGDALPQALISQNIDVSKINVEASENGVSPAAVHLTGPTSHSTYPPSTSDSDTSDSSARMTTDQESSAPPINTHPRLRRDKNPRYRCGTCGLHDCTCNHLIQQDYSTKPLVVNDKQEYNISPRQSIGHWRREDLYWDRALPAIFYETH